MANWYGAARSNYFKVKDIEAFKAEMEKYEVEVLEPRAHDGKVEYEGKVGLASKEQDSGDWPSYSPELDEDIELWQIVAPHLADGEVAVFQTIGTEKLRYLTGHAVAVTNDGFEVWVSIDDIYAKAANVFDIPRETITLAHY